MIVRFVMRVHIADDSLERLPQIVGIGDQEPARAFRQRAQTGLRIRSAHGVALGSPWRTRSIMAPALPVAFVLAFFPLGSPAPKPVLQKMPRLRSVMSVTMPA